MTASVCSRTGELCVQYSMPDLRRLGVVSSCEENTRVPRGEPESLRRALRAPELVVLILVLAVGLWLRWSYLQEIRLTPEFSHPLIDPLFNDYWARGMVTGDWSSSIVMRAYGYLPDIRNMPYFKAPGYAYFLSVVYRLFGLSYMAVRVVQMGAGLLSAVVALLLGRSVFGRPVGLVAAGFMSVYWGFIYFEGQLAEVSILTLLILLFLYFLYRCARFAALPNALLAGITLGIAALMRPNVLLLAVAAASWGWWVVRRRRGSVWFPAFVVPLVLALIVTIAPVTLRNYAVSGEFVPISTNLGINLYIGNNESSEGTIGSGSSEVSGFGSCFDYDRTVARLERSLGTRLTPSDVSAHYLSKAVEFATHHPGRLLRLTLRKAYLLVSPHEITLNRVVYYDRLDSRTLSAIALRFPAALSLGIVGTFLILRARRRKATGAPSPLGTEAAAYETALLVPLLALTYLASLLPFFIASSYRMPVVPLLLLPGAYAVCWIGSRLAARDIRVAALWLVLLLAVFVLASVPFLPYEPDLGKWHLDRGTVRDLDHLYADAAAEYHKAIAAAPDSAPVHYNLGIVLARLGDLDAAAVEFERATELDPGLAAAHSSLAHVRLTQGRKAEAADSYRRAVRANPRSVRDRASLATLLMKNGSFHEAARLLEEALMIDPNDVISLVSLSQVLSLSPYKELRDGKRAVQLAERAIKIEGGNDPSLFRTLAAAYAEAGDFEAAVRAEERALAGVREAGLPTGLDEKALSLYKEGRPYLEK